MNSNNLPKVIFVSYNNEGFFQATVILVQNAFPILEKYIDHPHIVDGKPLRVINTLKDEILNNFKYLMELKKSGRNLFFPDIDRIKEIMLDELKNN